METQAYHLSDGKDKDNFSCTDIYTDICTDICTDILNEFDYFIEYGIDNTVFFGNSS